ncbi:MAG: O-antigen ligase family protein [Ignavibacteriales bacterium]|nr:O-antigen ligase family protein [Ignavibacteriales bacterium]
MAGIYLFALSLPISFVPAEFGLTFAILGWLLEGTVNKNWQFESHALFAPLAFYIAWNVTSAAISPRPWHSLWAVADNEWSLFIMLMMFWIIRDEKTYLNLAYMFLAGLMINTCYGLAQSIIGVELWRGAPLDLFYGIYRIVGFQNFYLTFAAFVLASFFLSLNLSLVLKGKARIVVATFALLSAVALIETYARSIWLALLVTVPVFVLLKLRKTRILFISIFIGAVGAILILVPTIRDRALSIVDIQGNQTRINLWRTSINIFKDFPLTGVGEDNFDYYFEKYRAGGFYDTTVNPHNDYLNVLVSSGIPGLVSFLALWFITLREGYRTARSALQTPSQAVIVGATLTITGILVGSFFQNYYGTFANCLEWWFLAGLIFAGRRFTLPAATT